MADYFSDAYAPASANTAVGRHYRPPVNISHARLRTKVHRATGLFTTSDEVRMLSLRSSDRLLALHIGSGGLSTLGACNVGLALSGDNHDGAVEDADLFATAIVTSTAKDPWAVDAFAESGTLGGVDRGKTMWEIATLGTGTNYTADPGVNFDIIVVPSTTFTDAADEITMIAYYTAGD